MSLSNTQSQRNFRARKRADMGDDAYKALQAAQRKQRRQNQQQRPTTAPAPSPAETPAIPAVPSQKKTYVMYNQPTPIPTQNHTIDDIYKLKTDQAAANGRTIKRATVDEQYKNILKLHKKLFNSGMLNMDFLRDTAKVLNYINSNESWKQSSKNKMIQSISSILSVIPGLKKEYKIYSDVSTKNSKEHVGKAGDIINVEQFVDFKELKSLWKKTDNLFDMSLIGLYTILPPRRVKDANLITITHSTANLNPELNYILLDGDNKPIKLIYQNIKRHPCMENKQLISRQNYQK